MELQGVEHNWVTELNWTGLGVYSYYGQNVSPQNSYVEIHYMMILGGRVFGRWLGHEGSTFMNEISALITKKRKRKRLLFSC